MDEKSYILGQRQAWGELLSLALRELGYDSTEATASRWVREREAAIAQLRMLCDDFGDNEWDETLHLADVIEKHLGKHLHSR